MSEPTPAEQGRDLARHGEDADPPSDGAQEPETETDETDGDTGDMGANVKNGSASGTNSIGNYYDGIGDLDVHRRTSDKHWVLSRRNGSVTMHQVNLMELTCSCDDETYNRETHEPCAHLAKAVLVESNRPESAVEVSRLREDVNRARDEFLQLRNELQVSTRSAQADAAATASGSSEEGSPEPEPDADPEELMADWLSANDLDPEDFNIWTESGQVRVESTDLSDKDFSHWTTASWKPDGMGYDGDDYYNYVAVSDAAEVLG